MQNQKNQKSKFKTLSGGLAALGIFASFFAFGHNEPNGENLKADVADPAELLVADAVESPAAEPSIIRVEPTSGAVGDIVAVIVTDLDELTNETGGIFFGDTAGEIETVDAADDGTLTVFSHVPEMLETGIFELKITTSTELIANGVEFEVTELSELAPAPEEIMEPGTEPAASEKKVAEIKIAPEEITSTPIVNVVATPTTSTKSSASEISSAQFFGNSAPQNLQASVISGGIELEWDAASDADHFNIYYGTTSGKYIHRVESEITSAILTSNFADGTRYFFVVSAVGTDGAESSTSDETAVIFSTKIATVETPLHAASELPTKLSTEGPAETFLISIFAALGIAGIIFRRRIFAGK